MKSPRSGGLFAMLLTLTLPASVHAINQTTSYQTNMGNYRVCTSPSPLGTCDFAYVSSPSKYYLADGTTTTVVNNSNGNVQIRVDANGIATDTDVSYSCADTQFTCSGGLCAAGPNAGNGCTVNRCIGGTNNGGVCSTASACPGGSCTGGAACVAQTCQTGPRAGLQCGGAQPACTSTANTTGWTVVFRGNVSYQVTSTWPTYHYRLVGDDDAGCMKVCSFNLDSNGAVNTGGSSTLSCSVSGGGSCASPETFHYVEIRDPDDEILAIPTVGSAKVFNPTYGTVEGDPAQVGDCTRDPGRGICTPWE